METNKIKGISLIVLLITIIIMIILASAIILSITNNDLINKTSDSVRLNNESTIHEALNYSKITTEENCIRSTPFASPFSGNLKTYIESKIGTNLSPLDFFYKIETDKLNIKTDPKKSYIFSKKLNTVIEIEKNELEDIKKVIAVWFWCNSTIPEEIKYVDNPLETKRVLDKLKELNVNIIYIPIDIDKTDRYTNFIKEAYKRDMYVYALYGDPQFVFEEIRPSSVNSIIDAITEYNENASYDSKIRGIHYDVEPYANSQWVDGQGDAAKSNICRTSYLDFITEVYNYSKGKNITIGYDIPVWWDRYTAIHDGVEKNIAEEVIKLADEITFMDYTTNANNIFLSLDNKGKYTFGDGTTITLTESVLERLEKYKKDYIVGVDLSVFEAEAEAKINRPDLVPTYIAEDYEYTYPYITSMLKDVEKKLNIFNKDNGLNSDFGFAYHHIYPLLELTGY
ncbi:MAG: hypothetical protein PHD20_00170 [Clostridia bacterium]|nr:hypothetical protein [Clostridia bacterium]